MNRSMCQSAKDYFDTMNQVLSRIDYDIIDKLVNLLIEAQHNNRQIFVFGNGGSACTSAHFGLEFVMTGQAGGPKALQVHSLADNIGLLTALSNDIAFDDVFSYQLASLANAGDVAIAITGSGNSPNILKACQWSKDNGLTVVALTGFDGGKVKDLADIQIHIPSNNYGIIEDLHMSIGHIIGQRLHLLLS
ncbi:MAG: phosphoheptose isomerase [Gammaproteobacteria bacterium]|nr:MAG: phosphoheptose isomerase [Gammaproteobacteria bacterium]RKZ43730.1 MAG: phosphoheptose isomerase [Gammaproteobacteria bacterium]RKZ72304.1 MAG: phosphoheptose isomerase [Gammaproteobacteria bacterium]